MHKQPLSGQSPSKPGHAKMNAKKLHKNIVCTSTKDANAIEKHSISI
jgi:hypothetical protein